MIVRLVFFILKGENKMKLNKLFELYLEDVDITHQETTLDSIRYRYNSHIRQIFGDQELEDIDFKEIKRFQKNMLSGKLRSKRNTVYSISYINIVVMLLKRLIKYAILMNYMECSVEKSRILETIKEIADKEKINKPQVIWNINDFNEFIKYVDEDAYNVLFNVLFYTGIRKGEALALQWKDIDLIEHTITIEKTACKVSGKGQIVKKPKTKSSHRVVYMNDSLNDILLNYFIEQKSKTKMNINHFYVFGGIKMIAYSTLDRNFIKYKEKANVSNMTLHGFRHSHATMMLELTNDVYNVSKRLGHENIEVTETYLHINSKVQKEMADKLEEVIHQEQFNNYEIFIANLKITLTKEITNSTYSINQLNQLKKIYDLVNCKS